jgi:dienelactone hydrolase
LKISSLKYKDGTEHHAARGYVVLWATLMAHAKPNHRGSIAEISREMMEAIDLDEQRQDKGEAHEL